MPVSYMTFLRFTIANAGSKSYPLMGKYLTLHQQHRLQIVLSKFDPTIHPEGILE